jgi:hypothetical protein
VIYVRAVYLLSYVSFALLLSNPQTGPAGRDF